MRIGGINLIGIYFSGTGNTRHCVTEFVKQFSGKNVVASIEEADVLSRLAQQEIVVFGYPVYFSNTPRIVKDFITGNEENFRGKKVFIIATLGLFSGDGAGCAARLFKKAGAEIVGGLHLMMPDSTCDVKMMKKTHEENLSRIAETDKKIALAAQSLKNGKPPHEGLSFINHAGGLLGQRLWFRGKTASYKSKPDVNTVKCTGCGKCEGLCPMKNLSMENGKAAGHDRCTLCYRCVASCPAKALTILGKEVHEQWRMAVDN